jgi:hypothetical protein
MPTPAALASPAADDRAVPAERRGQALRSADPAAHIGIDVWHVWGPDPAARPALLLGRPSMPLPMWRDAH